MHDGIHEIIKSCDSYNDLKIKLNDIFGSFIVGLSYDENDDVCIINTSELRNNLEICSKNYELIKMSPNYIIEKNPFRVITRFMYCEEKNVSFNNKIVNEYLSLHGSYEVVPLLCGNIFVVVCVSDKWIVCSDKIETGEKYHIDFDALDKKYCYHFTTNKGVIYSNEVSNCKLLIVFEKYNNIIVNNNTIKQCMHIDNYSDLKFKLELLENECKKEKYITCIGFLVIDSCVKIHTNLYCYLKDRMVNSQNVYQLLLELYQENKLNELAPFITKYVNDNIHRINSSLKTISKEILNIYHITRHKKNDNIYGYLPDIYKKVLYDLHGMYIEGVRNDHKNIKKIDNIEDMDEGLIDSNSITIHDVYYYLKELNIQVLVDIYKERLKVMESNNLSSYFSNCIHTIAQTKLM